MKDDWNLKDYKKMKYHHMMEEGIYPEEAVDKLRYKLQEALARGELDAKRVNELFGAIDTEYMKEFWEKRANDHVLNEGLTNLEDNEELLKRKIKDEESKVLPLIDWKDKTILDLGAGWGNWAFKFIDKGAKHVTCVDYIEEMCKKGEEIAKRDGVKNIKFVPCPIQKFHSNVKYDVVFISGVSVHLNDIDYLNVVENMKSYTKPGTILILRDGTGIPDTHSFDKEWSERLQTLYSGIYRSKEAYAKLFGLAKFALESVENMFPEGHPLNRFPKTRLCLFKFVRVKELKKNFRVN